MSINEVFELRKQGRTEEAYEAARQIYATDRRPYASAAMFWTAVDILRLRVCEGRMDEAAKIYQAMERLLGGTTDKNGWMHDALERCKVLIEGGEMREQLSGDGPEHLQMGIWGEELAVAFLREKGYVILERDWHSKHRDIDIIAQDGDVTVFIEVKTRRNRDFADPLDSIDYRKRYNLRRAINHYVKYRNILNHRFDVITIVGAMGPTMPEITHIEDFSLRERETWHPQRGYGRRR